MSKKEIEKKKQNNNNQIEVELLHTYNIIKFINSVSCRYLMINNKINIIVL